MKVSEIPQWGNSTGRISDGEHFLFQISIWSWFPLCKADNLFPMFYIMKRLIFLFCCLYTPFCHPSSRKAQSEQEQVHICTRHGGQVTSGSRTHGAGVDLIHVREDLTIALTSLWLFPRWKGAATSGSNKRHSSTVFHSFCVPCIHTLPVGALPGLLHSVTQQWESASFHQCEIKTDSQLFKWTMNLTPFQREQEMSPIPISAQILQTQIITTWRLKAGD